MIAFVMDRLAVATVADLTPANVTGHGLSVCYSLCPVSASTTMDVRPVVPSPTREELERLCLDLAATMRSGLRVVLADEDLRRAPTLATAYLVMAGHSWDDAWEAVARLCRQFTADADFHSRIRLLAREAWAVVR